MISKCQSNQRANPTTYSYWEYKFVKVHLNKVYSFTDVDKLLEEGWIPLRETSAGNNHAGNLIVIIVLKRPKSKDA